MTLGLAGGSALWYLTRSTGAVALLLLTLSVALGVANVERLHAAGWPRFVLEGIHRNVSLLALVMLLVHIATSVLDPFAGIHLIDAIIPFAGTYRPFWLGLGAFASDVLIAVALTGIVRRHLTRRAWRATHWLAYVCWPLAVLHTVGTGSDVTQVWLQAILGACGATVLIAVWFRIASGWPRQRRLRAAALAASVAMPAAFLIWLPSGPLAANWARRAGTPAKDLAEAGASTGSPSRPSTRASSVRSVLTISSLEATSVVARISSADGQVLRLAVAPQIGAGMATGTLQVSPQ